MTDGEYIEYYISGVIKYKCNYIDDEVHGESIYYYISGNIISKYYHISGEMVTELEYNRNLKLDLLGL